MLVDTRDLGPRTLVHNSVLYFWDNTRNKYLSVGRHMLSFGIDHANLTYKRYMAMTGNVYSNTTGYRIIRDATITAISVNTKGISDCKFNIKKNGIDNLTTIFLTSTDGIIIDDLNISLYKSDWIQAEIDFDDDGHADFPELLLEIAWRKNTI